MTLLLLVAAVLPAASETAPAPAWVTHTNAAGRSYEYGTAVTTDSAGNVYVTGSSDDDYFTAKYGADGSEQWTARYDGPRHGIDSPVAIVVNPAGDVFVTGASYGGTLVSGGSDYDLTTVKYNASGQEQWVQRFNGAGNQDDAARGMVLGPDGSVYVTGYAYRSLTAWDFVTMKYEADGLLSWWVYYDHNSGADRAAAISSDAQGNVYVTGAAWAGASDFDYVTISYDGNGDRRWVESYNGPQNGSDSATAITASPEGGCWVTGSSGGTNNADVATVRYDASGTRLWSARFNGSGNGPDIGQAITRDAAGNCYVAGLTHGAQSGADYVALKYGPTGGQVWAATYDGGGSLGDQATGIAERNHKVYVTGKSGNAQGGSGFATLKLSETGSVLWTARYEGAVFNFGGANALALGVDGSINVFGSAWSLAGGQDFATLQYPAPVPGAPTALTAVVAGSAVHLSWSHTGEDATGFLVERKVGSGAFSLLAAVGSSANTYLDTAVAPGVTYAYRVHATGPGGDSGLSNVQSLRFPGGVAGKISVTPAKVSFGTVLQGKSKLKKIKIKNTGKGLLSGEIQPLAAPFAVVSGGGAFSLAPKKSVTVTVSYAPSSAGASAAIVGVSSDDPDRPTVSVALTGKGK